MLLKGWVNESCSQKETKKNHDYKPTAFAFCADCSLRFSADFTFNTNVFEGVLKQAAGYVVVPFQNGIATIGGYLSDRSDELAQLKGCSCPKQRSAGAD